MQNLIEQLTRLYLARNSLPLDALAQHLSGHKTVAINLVSDDGLTRAMVISFAKSGDDDSARHWVHLCSVANALQSEFGFPAPAVSISGSNSYGLWLSLASPVPVVQAHQFMELLRKAYLPEMELCTDGVGIPVELPPCLHQSTGKWAAFIHPGMGESFADESWLEMAPPIAGQIAFLKDLQSISAVPVCPEQASEFARCGASGKFADVVARGDARCIASEGCNDRGYRAFPALEKYRTDFPASDPGLIDCQVYLLGTTVCNAAGCCAAVGTIKLTVPLADRY